MSHDPNSPMPGHGRRMAEWFINATRYLNHGVILSVQKLSERKWRAGNGALASYAMCFITALIISRQLTRLPWGEATFIVYYASTLLGIFLGGFTSRYMATKRWPVENEDHWTEFQSLTVYFFVLIMASRTTLYYTGYPQPETTSLLLSVLGQHALLTVLVAGGDYLKSIITRE